MLKNDFADKDVPKDWQKKIVLERLKESAKRIDTEELINRINELENLEDINESDWKTCRLAENSPILFWVEPKDISLEILRMELDSRNSIFTSSSPIVERTTL